MKGNLKFIFIGLFVILSSFVSHKYYNSITKIEIDDNEKLLKIHTQLFVDDFEQLLKERYNMSSLVFSNLSEKEKEIVKNYVTKKMQIKINRSPVELMYLGCEVEGELLYIYLESETSEVVKRIDVENKLLQDLFTEQHNTVDVSYKNKVKSLYLHAEAPSGTLFF